MPDREGCCGALDRRPSPRARRAATAPERMGHKFRRDGDDSKVIVLKDRLRRPKDLAGRGGDGDGDGDGGGGTSHSSEAFVGRSGPAHVHGVRTLEQ